MSGLALDIEFANKNVFEELKVFIDGNFQGYPTRSSKKYKPTKQADCCTRNLHRIVWNSGQLDYMELLSNLPRDIKGEYFPIGTEKCKVLASLINEDVENMDDYDKVQGFVDEET